MNLLKHMKPIPSEKTRTELPTRIAELSALCTWQLTVVLPKTSMDSPEHLQTPTSDQGRTLFGHFSMKVAAKTIDGAAPAQRLPIDYHI